MIDLEIIKKDIVNRVLASSGKRKIQDNTVYGLNLIQDIFILEINQLKEQVAYLNNKIKDSNGHILSLNQKVEKLESGEFVLVPRNPTKEQLLNPINKEMTWQDALRAVADGKDIDMRFNGEFEPLINLLEAWLYGKEFRIKPQNIKLNGEYTKEEWLKILGEMG